MQDRFEKFVKDHREEFDIHIPGPEVWDKIAQNRKKTKLSTRRILKVTYRVAAVVMIFFLSYAYHEFRDIRKNKVLVSRMNEEIYQVMPELKETEYYYNNLVDLKMKELQPFLNQVPGMKDEISRDFSELDSMYVSLKKDLMDNIANDQVLEAMIQNYRLKLEILEDLLMEVKNQNQNENTAKDKYRI